MAFSQLLSIWWSSYFFHSHGIFVNTSEKWTKDNFDSCWSPLKYQTSFFLFQNKLHNIAIAQLVNVLGVIIYNNTINCNKIYIHTDSKNLYSWTYFGCWHLQFYIHFCSDMFRLTLLSIVIEYQFNENNFKLLHTYLGIV